MPRLMEIRKMKGNTDLFPTMFTAVFLMFVRGVVVAK